MILSGAYHWHNGVYNQIHSNPSVHRDMNPDVVLYSQRLRDAGYRLGYIGKWHASYKRQPLDFGYHEVAAVNGCDPEILKGINMNPDNVPAPAGPPRHGFRAFHAMAGIRAVQHVGLSGRRRGGHARNNTWPI